MIGLRVLVAAGVQVFLLSMALPLCSQTPVSQYSGMVWERHGDWHINGSRNSVRLGEAVLPGSLLTGGVSGEGHSLVILMPDGQHLLFECFDAGTCNQGFRVPAITLPPSPEVWSMFVGVRNALLLRPSSADAAFLPQTGRESMVGRREVVAAVSPDGEISPALALEGLPSGHYTLAVNRDGGQEQESPAEIRALDWQPSHEGASLHVGPAGVYRLHISDPAKISRLDIEVLAVPPAVREREAAGLTAARKIVLQWSAFHPGWSLHDFLRAYLQSRAIALAAN